MREEAFKNYAAKVLLRPFKKLELHIEGVYSGSDAEDLHRIRVAIRRLRNMFWVFKDVLPARSLKKWKKIFKKMARNSGGARDLDVKIDFMKKLSKEKSQASLKSGLKQMIMLLQEKRNKLQPGIVLTLNENKKEKILDDIKKILKKLSQAPKKKKEISVYDMAFKQTSKRLKALYSYASFVSQPENTEELHNLRIEAKKLRYTLECFIPASGKKLIGFAHSAHMIQNHLGIMRDFDVWIQTLPLLLSNISPGKDLTLSKEHFLRTCGKLRDNSYKKFLSFWKKLEKENYREKLLETLKEQP